MKKLRVNVIPYEKSLAVAARESGTEAVVRPDGDSEKVRQFGTTKPINKVIHRILGIFENALQLKLNRVKQLLKQSSTKLIEK